MQIITYQGKGHLWSSEPVKPATFLCFSHTASASVSWSVRWSREVVRVIDYIVDKHGLKFFVLAMMIYSIDVELWFCGTLMVQMFT